MHPLKDIADKILVFACEHANRPVGSKLDSNINLTIYDTYENLKEFIGGPLVDYFVQLLKDSKIDFVTVYANIAEETETYTTIQFVVQAA